jgi:hypothetical protein
MTLQSWKQAAGILVFLSIAVSLTAQEPAFSSISRIVEVGTVAVVFSPSKAEILREGRLATSKNIALLANVRTICVLPYDGMDAKNVIANLPALSSIRAGLESNKSLRQQRNEASEELIKRGFQTTDCLLSENRPDAELLFSKVKGGGGDNDLPSIFWLLYAGEQFSIVVHGERELMGLARPAFGSQPWSLNVLADQVKAVTDVAKASPEAYKFAKFAKLSEADTICVLVSGGDGQTITKVIELLRAKGQDVASCEDSKTALYELHVTQEASIWWFSLEPRGGQSSIYDGHASIFESGVNDFADALKKAKASHH